jgi:DNA recombination protein RmuC
MDIIAIIAFVAGGVIGWLVKPRVDISALKENLDRMRRENADLRNENKNLVAANAALGALNKELPEKIESLSLKLLRDQSKESKEFILDPFAKQMREWKKGIDEKIESMNKDSAEQKGSLEKHLQMIASSAGNLQKGAEDLVRAFRGNKKLSGTWAEAVIEGILQQFEFKKGFQYDAQVCVEGDDGKKYFLDFVINLPDGKKIIIDSKVSVDSFIKYENAENDGEKEQHLAELVAATKNHVKGLSEKEYQKKLKDYRLDFVFMVIPREDMYFAIMEKCPTLYDDAIKENIAIVNPSLLYPAMRTINYLMQVDRQEKNIAEVIDMINKLYEKYTGFTDNFDRVGKKLADAREAYDSALGQLSSGSGNISGWFDKIKKKSGITTTKRIQIEYEKPNDDE